MKTKQKPDTTARQKHAKQRKQDAVWFKNISSRPLDKTEHKFFPVDLNMKWHINKYQLKIESDVEAVLSKNNFRNRVTSTLQSASLSNSYLTTDKLKLWNNWKLTKT